MPGPLNASRRPRERLPSLNDPSSLAAFKSRARPTPPPPPPRPTVPRQEYHCCASPEVEDDGTGMLVCMSCAQVHEQANIVADVQFEEGANGRAMAVGDVVRHDQRHANTMGGTVAGINLADSRQSALSKGHAVINGLCTRLNLSAEHPITNNARKWYRLGLNHNFVSGRGILKAASAAIYLAARKHPQNTLMLMDLAECTRINVFALGTVYRQFCQTLMENDPAEVGGNSVLQIEPLMLKFCERLEFAQDSHKVASDACLILKRMSRDWMVQGRNPAGLCGACIILAARMNNFRRTVREVVFVVKVADTTINQRLYEYRRTQSSLLSVKQFREIGHRLKTKIEPPSVYKRREKEERAAKRKADALEESEAGSVADRDSVVAENDEEEGGEETPQPAKPKKLTKRQEAMRKTKKKKTNNGEGVAVEPQNNDVNQGENQDEDEGADQMVIDYDALAGDDIEAGLDALANANAEGDEDAIAVPKKRRGRPPKKREPIVVPEEDLAIEKDLENEMGAVITDWESTFKEFVNNEEHHSFQEAFEKARKLVELHKQPEREGVNNEEIGEDEFEDDEDVKNVKLSYEESKSKEKVWILANEEWLREQQKKMFAKALEEAQGKTKKPKQKRRRLQMGDGSLLAGQTVNSAAEATRKMLEKRAKHFSSHINYDVLKTITGGSSSSSAVTTPAAQAATPPPAAPQPAPTHQVVPVGDDDDEEEEVEEQYEGQYVEEDEGVEHQYLSDDDEGFDPNDNYDF